ncbi:MAG: hypothetical protein KBC43_05180 [Bacteroidales bacterium]|nr:hypothetical protein [Bacteroidales bacterium]
MLKESKIFQFLVLLGIIACSPSKDKIVFEPYIENIIDIYLIDNEDLNPSNYDIILTIEDVGENEFILYIMSEMSENIPFNFTNHKENIYSGHYQQFRTFIVGNNQRVLIRECNEYEFFKKDTSLENVPISYNGALWTIKIQNHIISDFSYKFCKPEDSLIEQLKSIQVNPQ